MITLQTTVPGFGLAKRLSDALGNHPDKDHIIHAMELAQIQVENSGYFNYRFAQNGSPTSFDLKKLDLSHSDVYGINYIPNEHIRCDMQDDGARFTVLNGKKESAQFYIPIKPKK